MSIDQFQNDSNKVPIDLLSGSNCNGDDNDGSDIIDKSFFGTMMTW